MGAKIDADAIYRPDEVLELLQIGKKTLGNLCTSGALRFRQHGHERFFRGAWLIDWIEKTSNKPQKSAKTKDDRTTIA